jgi:hypothetical protein
MTADAIDRHEGKAGVHAQAGPVKRSSRQFVYIFVDLLMGTLLAEQKNPRLCEPGKVYFNNYSTKNTKLLD